MFNFFKRKNKNKNDLVDKNGNVIKKSSIVNDRNNVRFLKLGDYYDTNDS